MKFATLTLLAILCVAACCYGQAGYKTTNFAVVAESPELAKKIGDAAEFYRAAAAKYWFGDEIPTWSRPCIVYAYIHTNSSGATTYEYGTGTPSNWKMNIYGTADALLKDCLPHEVTHTVFASYFRQPPPRWLDEGAASTIERRSVNAAMERKLITVLKTGRGIGFPTMFALKDYPHDMGAFYAQGHSVCQWLIEKHGPRKLMELVRNGLADDNWPRAVREVYGYATPLAMQQAWNSWVKEGRPNLYAANYQECGSCQDGYCYPQTYAPSRPQLVQPARPVQPSRPALTPIAPPTVATPAAKPPNVSAKPCDCAEKWGLQNTVNARLRTEIDASNKQIADLTTQLATAQQQLSEVKQSVSVVQQAPAEPPAPNYDDLAAEVGKRLKHSAEWHRLDGKIETQTRPLNEPLKFQSERVGIR